MCIRTIPLNSMAGSPPASQVSSRIRRCPGIRRAHARPRFDPLCSPASSRQPTGRGTRVRSPVGSSGPGPAQSPATPFGAWPHRRGRAVHTGRLAERAARTVIPSEGKLRMTGLGPWPDNLSGAEGEGTQHHGNLPRQEGGGGARPTRDKKRSIQLMSREQWWLTLQPILLFRHKQDGPPKCATRPQLRPARGSRLELLNPRSGPAYCDPSHKQAG